MALDIGRLRRGQDFAVLIDIEDGLAIGIFAASEERAEPPVLIHHRLTADSAFMFAYLFF